MIIFVMDITVTPDTYTPFVDDKGNYIDKIPLIKNGIYCVCGSRRDKVYNSSTFSNHIKTKCHQKWIESLNTNKANYYVELIKYKEIVANQQSIIKKMDNQLSDKSLTIDYLTKQLHEKLKPSITCDLLNIDEI